MRSGSLAAVGKALTIVGLVVCAAILLLGVLYQRPMVPQLLVAITLAISIIPEGLPATATIVMALGVQRMARRHALVKTLPAVETLGGVTVICSDTTGTLTLNRMTVTHVATDGGFTAGEATPVDDLGRSVADASNGETGTGIGSAAGLLLTAAALCNDASLDPDHPGEVIGDPTEGALIRFAQRFGIDHEALEDRFPRVAECPFDSERQRMTTVHRVGDGLTAYAKGSVEGLLPLCDRICGDDGTVRAMTSADRGRILALCRGMAGDAQRTLGFAMRTTDASQAGLAPGTPDACAAGPGSPVLASPDPAVLERGFVFLGVTGMIDPLRREAGEAVRSCSAAGIRTVMITGDHPLTALAIARDLGIHRPGDTVVTGADLARMDDAALDAVVGSATVFARVTPGDKLRIIDSLRRTGEVIAMTGDGVNDSPALEAADIGVAMGVAGTDVAKGAADMILLDDSFATIAVAVKEGRRVARNIQKVIQFLLAGNIAEITTLLVAAALNLAAPLSGAHILWVNLATATRHAPVRSGTLFDCGLVGRVLAQGVFVALMTTAAYWVGTGWGAGAGGHAVGQTMAFCVLAFSQLLRALNQRSTTEPVWVRAEGANPWLVAAVLCSLALTMAVLLVPALREAFGLASLTGGQWAVTAALAAMSLVQMEVAKLPGRLRGRRDAV
ncbi:cation-translocating P-type ATPase [Bifidobacterium pullorum]|nr:cation-translocating P-type ATPase [Bifidobacterium pullorum]